MHLLLCPDEGGGIAVGAAQTTVVPTSVSMSRMLFAVSKALSTNYRKLCVVSVMTVVNFQLNVTGVPGGKPPQ